MARTSGGGGGSFGFGGLLASADLQLASDKAVLWSSTTDASGLKDVGLARLSANTLKVTAGAAGNGNLAAAAYRAAGGGTGGLWFTPSTDLTATPDVFLMRAAAGVLGIYSDLSSTPAKVVAGTLLVGDGTSSAPSYSFDSETTTGLYRWGTGSTLHVYNRAAGGGFYVSNTDTNPTGATSLGVFNRFSAGNPTGGIYLYSFPNSYADSGMYLKNRGYLVADGNLSGGLVVGTSGGTPGTQDVCFATAGTIYARVTNPGSTTSYVHGSDVVIGWSSTAPGSGLTTASNDTQLKRDSAGVVGVYASGGTYGTLASDTLALSSSGTLKISSTASPSGSPDIGLARASAGVLKITDGGSNYGNLAAGSLTQTTTNQGSITTAATLSDGGTHTVWSLALTDTSSAAASRLIKATVGGTSVFEVMKTGAMLARRDVVTKTGDYAVQATDSNRVFNDAGAGSITINFTLPAASTDGLVYTFVQVNSAGGASLKLTRAGSDAIIDSGSVGSTLTSTTAGYCVTIASLAGSWYVLSKTGTWTLA